MDNGSLRDCLERRRRQGQLSGEAFAETANMWVSPFRSASQPCLTNRVQLYQIAVGMEYLHGEGVVHGDLHAANVLIDENSNARVTDFGMSLISEASAYNYGSIHGGGATRWQAPELIDPEEMRLKSSRPTTSSDVFSFACMCIEVRSSHV